MMPVLLVLQVVLAAMLAWSCFCRLVKTDHETVREIRLAIWFEAVAAGLVMAAPALPALVPQLLGTGLLRWEPGETPTWIWLVLLAAATGMQLVTARYWRHGTPTDFRSTP